jgi:UDP-glucose 4-epimerase
MKILVTGGAGFIGSHVVDAYVDAGHEVVVVDNLLTGNLNNLNPKAKFYLLDIRNDEIEKVFELERPDVVNHHAAQISVPLSTEDPSLDADINILGLINLLENCVKYNVKKFIFASTGGAIYGITDNIPTPETEPPRPLSPYAISKLASEHYIRFYHHQHGLDYTILRYANIYGPRQIPHGEAGVVSIFITSLLNNKLPTIYHYPDAPEGMTRDYCHVYDVARANLLALEHGDAETINIGTGIETTTESLYMGILKTLRGEGIQLDGKFENPARGPARPGDLPRSALSPELARRLLGWQPEVTMTEGLKTTARYFIKNGS